MRGHEALAHSMVRSQNLLDLAHPTPLVCLGSPQVDASVSSMDLGWESECSCWCLLMLMVVRSQVLDSQRFGRHNLAFLPHIQPMILAEIPERSEFGTQTPMHAIGPTHPTWSPEKKRVSGRTGVGCAGLQFRISALRLFVVNQSGAPMLVRLIPRPEPCFRSRHGFRPTITFYPRSPSLQQQIPTATLGNPPSPPCS